MADRFADAPITKRQELAVRIAAALNRAFKDGVCNWEWEMYKDEIGPILFVLDQYKVEIPSEQHSGDHA